MAGEKIMVEERLCFVYTIRRSCGGKKRRVNFRLRGKIGENPKCNLRLLDIYREYDTMRAKRNGGEQRWRLEIGCRRCAAATA